MACKEVVIGKIFHWTEHGIFIHVMPIQNIVCSGKIRCTAVIQKNAAGQGKIAKDIAVYIGEVIAALHQGVIDGCAVHPQPAENIRVEAAQFFKGRRIVGFLRNVGGVDGGIGAAVNLLIIPDGVNPYGSQQQKKQGQKPFCQKICYVQQTAQRVHQFLRRRLQSVSRTSATAEIAISITAGRLFSTRPVTGMSS